MKFWVCMCCLKVWWITHTHEHMKGKLSFHIYCIRLGKYWFGVLNLVRRKSPCHVQMSHKSLEDKIVRNSPHIMNRNENTWYIYYHHIICSLMGSFLLVAHIFRWLGWTHLGRMCIPSIAQSHCPEHKSNKSQGTCNRLHCQQSWTEGKFSGNWECSIYRILIQQGYNRNQKNWLSITSRIFW